MSTILTLQVLSCFFMTGAIWLVQILVYPNFQLLHQKDFFADFHRFHTKRITWVVAPVMGIEFISGAWLCLVYLNPTFICNFISILLVWGFTCGVSVPIHNRLEKNPDAEKRSLVISNWPRTILWTLRSAFWFWFIQNQDLGIAL
jgi:hypothetical protein